MRISKSPLPLQKNWVADGEHNAFIWTWLGALVWGGFGGWLEVFTVGARESHRAVLAPKWTCGASTKGIEHLAVVEG